MERRSFTAGELRLDRAEGKSKVGGYAARFNSESLDLGGFVERIAPGAFSRALQAGADVRALLNHNSDIVLGRSKSGTLRLAEDANGLAFELDLPDTQAGRDLAVLIERRDIAEMSFGFKMRKDQWAKLGPDAWLRTLLDVDLLDVSPVAYPAYPSTEVGMRSAVAVDAVAGLAAAKAADEARCRRLALLERSVRS
jgi:HK97 family phage prohead protease